MSTDTADSLPSICASMSPKNVVYKKICKDKSVGVYMGRRDFIDHVDSVDPVDGVVIIDHEALQGRKVALQPAPNDVGKQCLVEFEIKVFSAESQDAKIKKRSSVKLMIRKVQYAPESQGVPPSVETTKVMSDKPLHVKASLDKELYYHGEVIHVDVCVTNETHKHVKNIILSVDQIANVVLYSNDSYSKSVAIEEAGDSVSPGAILHKVFKLLPVLANNLERRGIVLDGKLKHEDTNLASSSIIKEGVLKEVLGIMVSYKVMVKVIIGGETEDEMEFQEFKRSNVGGMKDDEDEDGNVSGGEDMAPKEN
ncbi:Beta-arrestin-1 Arrestin beta-1 [Collichthys lucidus]|uniref:Beta-arrestin-1 Arrestin beta-1 n=1 Tax=Collichthys lucidus TaxID=240159 RepID=A0A4U5UVL8_COLLU|nr:Beta-arrestin-1 Arrestin beta-1 [Collichthys lucidus]